MSKAKIIIEAHRRAKVAAASATAWAIIAGAELQRVKADLCHSDTNFDEWLEAECPGVSRRTAYRYISLAKAIKKSASHRLRSLLTGELTAEETQQEILALVAKVTDGATITELYEEYGIVKRPVAAPAGGYHPDPALLAAWLAEQGLPEGTPYAELTAAQQKVYRQWESHRQAERALSPEQTAFDFYSPLINGLEGDQYGAKQWRHLPDQARARLRDTLRAMLAELDATFPLQG